MTLGLAFYILMLLWLVYANWPGGAPYAPWGNSIMLFCLFLLLGWRVFGPPIHG